MYLFNFSLEKKLVTEVDDDINDNNFPSLAKNIPTFSTISVSLYFLVSSKFLELIF